jgi:hypothetical protein
MLYAASIDGNIHPEEVEVMVNIKRKRFAVPNLSDVGNLCWFNQLINRMKL